MLLFVLLIHPNIILTSGRAFALNVATTMSIFHATSLALLFLGASFSGNATPLIDADDRSALAVVMERLGPDQPATGRSTFDALFTANRDGEWVYEVPYPFRRVLDRLDFAVGIRSDKKDSLIKTVLIPFSRCLNRNLTHPRQFVSPRMVIAIDTEPSEVPEEQPIFIKNRLFIGYQPKANTMEIISYNDAAGRFEFQVVSDYRKGGEPKVAYANRTLCMSCHQNGGAVFSRAPWGETSSNSDIAEQLVAQGSSGLDRLNFPTGTLDRSTDQARMFYAYQTLWGPMCEGQTPGESIRCRAGLLELMLEKRFFRIRGAFTDSQLVSNYFVPIAGVKFIERWANGIPIPTADVPNRRPLRLDPPTSVGARVDPLRVRPTRLALPFEEISRLIEGLASFMPFIDVKSLNDNLYEGNLDPEGVRWRYRGSCEIDNQEQGEDRALIAVECQVSDRSLRRHFNLLGDLSIRGEDVVAREPLNRWLVGDGMFFNNVYHEGSPISIDGENWKIVLKFNAGDSRLHVWLPDGAAVESVVIRWPRDAGAQTPLPPTRNFSGEAVMTLRPGYERIEAAIARMVERADAGELDVFDTGVFQGTRVIQALLDEMGVASTPWCCDDWSHMPRLAVTEHLATNTTDRTRAEFNQYCASCHALPNASPASFLSGTEDEVDRKLVECAEKIYYRLGMWDEDKKERNKTPMPPALRIAQLEHLISSNQVRVDLKHMRDHAATLLERNAAEIMENGYENTKACGPF